MHARTGNSLTCDLCTLEPSASRRIALKLRSSSPHAVAEGIGAGSLPELDPSNDTATKATTIK